MPQTVTVPSSRGVAVALHDLGGDGPPLLLCHPTGFHGIAWTPLAEELHGVAHCWAPDLRGHGDTAPPADGDLSWGGMVDDAAACARYIVEESGTVAPGTPLRGVGHSMGGASLVGTEVRQPGTFAGLWLFEPIVFPRNEGQGGPSSPMAVAARRRRPGFPDRAAALANYAAKPPLDALHPAALRAYVDHGLRDLPDGSVALKCTPELEASTFEGAMRFDVWPRLGEVGCPVTVAVGGDGAPPSQIAPLLVAQLPRGRQEDHPRLGHFGPLEDPAAMALAIRAALDLG